MSKGSSSKLSFQPGEVHKIRELLEEALALLRGKASAAKPQGRTKLKAPASEPLSYSLNIRAFMNRYGRSLSGPAKFTLLLARLAKGEVGLSVRVKDIETQWNKMTGVMGGNYNPAHSTRAKERGWLDAPKYGTYSLSDGWTEILGK